MHLMRFALVLAMGVAAGACSESAKPSVAGEAAPAQPPASAQPSPAIDTRLLTAAMQQ